MTRRSCTAILALVWVLIPVARSWSQIVFAPSSAETPASVAPAPAVPAGDATNAIERPPMQRDPFWPVGYVPPKPVPATSTEASVAASGTRPAESEPAKPAEWKQARAQLSLRGISSGGRDRLTGKNRFVAVLGGRLVEEGDMVAVTYEGQVYRWKVQSISAKDISLMKVDVRAEEAAK